MARFSVDGFGIDGPAVAAAGHSYHGSPGDDHKHGTAGDDTFDYSQGGEDSLQGRGGNDTFLMGAALDPNDRIAGGAGFDTVELSGDYAFRANYSQVFTKVEKIVFGGGHDYLMPLFDFLQPNNATLILDAHQLGHQHYVEIYGGDSGHYRLIGGQGPDRLFGGPLQDVIKGGKGYDYIVGLGGPDLLYGGQGHDTFDLGAPPATTGPNHDTIFDFDADEDAFGVNVLIHRIDHTVRTGSLNEATFDADLANAIGRDEMHRHHAVLFHPHGGDLAGHVFLIIDDKGGAGYQAGKDYVVDITGAAHLSDLSAASFHVAG